MEEKDKKILTYVCVACVAIIIVFIAIGMFIPKSEEPSQETVKTTSYQTRIATPTATISTPAPIVKENSDKTTLGEKNAAKKALEYLRFTSFSREGLIEQLEYEGFTHQQAVYGVDQSGADWNNQAALKAKEYLKFTSFSQKGLIEQLEYEGFTPQQAAYGVQAVGY